ncbi:TetR/AcrR family transcriptional regulator [Eudoraea adriatica]|uniref:TetR/AcrR family transcriptional regulator n=1 Tax=Eudoraea adriatica TaxID=446681 RepID=UPI000363299B|nr:TetR/AcrR family transcriptional regulator [Eudoraea adriatica]
MPRSEEFNREHAVRQAMNVFWEKGYNGTSMQDLVDATGLNRSSIYNSFGSKHELYKTTLEFYQKESGGLFHKALLNAKNPLGAIRLVFESFLPEILSEGGDRGCYAMNCKSELGNREGDIRKWLLANQENTLNVFSGLIKEGQEQGIINTKEDSKTYAYYIFNAFQGFRMTGILIKDRTVLQRIINNTLKVIS